MVCFPFSRPSLISSITYFTSFLLIGRRWIFHFFLPPVFLWGFYRRCRGVFSHYFGCSIFFYMDTPGLTFHNFLSTLTELRLLAWLKIQRDTLPLFPLSPNGPTYRQEHSNHLNRYVRLIFTGHSPNEGEFAHGDKQNGRRNSWTTTSTILASSGIGYH